MIHLASVNVMWAGFWLILIIGAIVFAILFIINFIAELIMIFFSDE